MKKILMAAVAASAFVSTAAIAAVTFDPASGTGFVGKGDVQLAFGWNNAVAQREARNVSFTYQSTESYDVTIEFDTGNPANPRSMNHHVVTQGKSAAVNASIASDPRRTGQYTGWNLNGLGNVTVTGDQVPEVGDSCPNGNVGTCVVTNVSLGSSTGGLYVNHGVNSVLIQ